MEFAVVLPLLITLLFGIIEFGWLFMVRQSLINAAREGCRIAVLQTATEIDRETRIGEAMAPLGLSAGQWSFTASEIDATTQWVTVAVPVSEVALTGSRIVSRTYTITGQCSMRKEGVVAGGDDGDDSEGDLADNGDSGDSGDSDESDV